MAILQFILKYKNIAVNAILSLCVALSLIWGITLHKKNNKLSESLEIAQNNIEAYQGVVNASQQANNVLKLNIEDLQRTNDKVLHQIDSVMKKSKIKSSQVTTAATQLQSLNVYGSRGVGGQVILPKDTIIKKDTVYIQDRVLKDSILFNNLTKVHYTIDKDSIRIQLDIHNSQYLYIYKKKEYKNKKNFFQRLFTFDWKKITKYKYKIVNTNELIKEDSIRIIESIEK